VLLFVISETVTVQGLWDLTVWVLLVLGCYTECEGGDFDRYTSFLYGTVQPQIQLQLFGKGGRLRSSYMSVPSLEQSQHRHNEQHVTFSRQGLV